MSNISFMEKLLDGVEVEWKAVSEIFHLRNGYTPSKAKNEFWDSGTIPWFRMEDIRSNGRILSDSIQHITKSAVKGALFSENSLIMSTTATVGEHALVRVPFLTNQQITNFSVVDSYKDKVDIKFLFYCFFDFGKWCIENANQSGGLKIIGIQKLKQYQIPIPCPENLEKSLKIQAEIVRILDTFTELTTELTTELNARKKQYSYYRDQLLSFEEGEGGWLALGDVGEVRMCKRIFKNQTSDVGDIPFYKIGTFGKEPNAYISRELFDEYKARYNYPKVGEVLISASGTIGRAVIFDGQDAYFQDSNIIWLENNEKKVLNKYLFYFYQVAEWNPSDGGVIKRLYNDNLKRVMIPVPNPDDPEKSLKEQARIVAILDKFDTLTTSITEGLPREIELRQKQYAYYRDLLLSFPRPVAEKAVMNA